MSKSIADFVLHLGNHNYMSTEAIFITPASYYIFSLKMYVAPFRKDLKRGHCIMCNKPTNSRYIIKGELNDEGELNNVLCICPSATNCEGCKVKFHRKP